jgi:hypothetical protein
MCVGKKLDITFAVAKEIRDGFGNMLGSHLQRFGRLDVRRLGNLRRQTRFDRIKTEKQQNRRCRQWQE